MEEGDQNVFGCLVLICKEVAEEDKVRMIGEAYRVVHICVDLCRGIGLGLIFQGLAEEEFCLPKSGGGSGRHSGKG